MDSSSNRFRTTADTPFLFAIFARFAVKSTTDTPFKFPVLSIYKGHSVFRGERENSLFVENLLATLPFLFAVFAYFAVKITTDTPF